MRFEILNEDKIRITLSHDDLVKKDIDFHSFMSNSIESQALFFDMLDESSKGYMSYDDIYKFGIISLQKITMNIDTLEDFEKCKNKGKIAAWFAALLFIFYLIKREVPI